MKRILLISFALLLCTQLPAQKWFKKVRKAQLNVMTYNAQGQLLQNTNGFLVGAEGMAVADYGAFRGATRAVVIDEGGKQYEVDYIAGANSLYDVVHFHIDGIKASPLKTAPAAGIKGQTAYIMPYLSHKGNSALEAPIADVSAFDEQHPYYTLTAQAPEKSTSCPVLNESGEVLGLLQMAVKDADKQCFALGVDYPLSLTTTAISATTSDYRDIGIRKALPTDPSQATSFIYLIGTRDTALYLSYVDDYIAHFPTEANGYTMKGEMLAAKGAFEQAEQAWSAGLKATDKADELHYSWARGIYGQTQAGRTLPESWTLERALAEAQAAYDANPLPPYIALQGHILYSQKAYDEACQKFVAVCQTNLRSAEHFLYAAQCRQMLSDTLGVLALQDSAVACFTKPYVSEAATALLMRSETLNALGRYRQAVADMNEYEHLRSNQVNANFYERRALAEQRCRMFQQALDDLERCCKMEPAEPLYQAELASLYYRVGQTDDCVRAARQAIALDAEFPDAYRILAVALRQQGNEAEAKQHLQKAADLGDTIAKGMLETDQ